MKNKIPTALSISAILLLALTLFSCEKPEDPPPPTVPAPPVEEKTVVPPVREGEEKVLTDAQWETRYGPAGEGQVILVGDIYVASRTDTPGTGENASFRWEEAMEYAAGLDWLGKTDWRLPTDDELMEIYRNRDLLEGFEEDKYWTSSLHHNIPDRAAAVIDFTAGRKRFWNKHSPFSLCLVRTR
jgi:hypothetical protein